MSEIDLSGVQAFAESLMVDVCRIYDPEDKLEGAWNSDTGTYDPPTPVYKYQGKCQIWSSKQGARTAPSGGADTKEFAYFVDIVKDSAEVRVEDRIDVLSVSDQGNQDLVGKTFVVESVDLYTYSVSKTIKCVMVEDAP